MTSERVCEVIVTAPDAEWLTEFARELVSDHVCASAHILPMRTIYRWQGRMHDKPETRAAFHTQISRVPEIVERVKAVHPYEVPAVAALPLVGGSPAYLEWVVQETRR
jgi:periplasmic divalent cation tolerance protein